MFTLQDGARITASNIAASPKGEIAIAGSALTANIQDRTFIARIGTDRTQQVITRTWPYCPRVVTFAPDGTVWTIGNLKTKEGIGDIPGHYLRRFDPSGKMLGSTTVRARGWHSDEISFLSASRDRVGWFTTDGEYIEFSLDGSEIARYDGPDGENARDITGVALSEENDVVAGHFGKGKAQFVALDRETHRWLPVALPAGYAPTWAWVLGFDGTTMVTYSEIGILHRLRMEWAGLAAE